MKYFTAAALGSWLLGTASLTLACESGDDPNTPGDDRARYVACADLTSGATETCGPGFGCCIQGPRCAESLEGCLTPFDFVSCDGPEDCDSGEQCWVNAHAVGCSATPTPYFYVFCHTDADCPDSARNPCTRGQCFGAPVPPTTIDG